MKKAWTCAVIRVANVVMIPIACAILAWDVITGKAWFR